VDVDIAEKGSSFLRHLSSGKFTNVNQIVQMKIVADVCQDPASCAVPTHTVGIQEVAGHTANAAAAAAVYAAAAAAASADVLRSYSWSANMAGKKR
jgi:hypothetical protein